MLRHHPINACFEFEQKRRMRKHRQVDKCGIWEDSRILNFNCRMWRELKFQIHQVIQQREAVEGDSLEKLKTTTKFWLNWVDSILAHDAHISASSKGAVDFDQIWSNSNYGHSVERVMRRNVRLKRETITRVNHKRETMKSEIFTVKTDNFRIMCERKLILKVDKEEHRINN